MAIQVGINGFGRIGRSVFRIISNRDDIEVVAINDLFDNEQLAYLLKYDTVMGVFRKEVRAESDALYVDSEKVVMTEHRDPAEIPWKKLGAQFVIEATGVFRNREPLLKHIQAGAEKVILTVPPKDEIDATIVMGVNDAQLKSEHRVVSNASCTTNCLAPIVKILDDSFGIEEGFITTVHAYTNDQRLADVPHKDFRRSRAAGENIAAAARPVKISYRRPPALPRRWARCCRSFKANLTDWPCVYPCRMDRLWISFADSTGRPPVMT
jgi:glyceraldehyde 3-phosphate dehydrogenase